MSVKIHRNNFHTLLRPVIDQCYQPLDIDKDPQWVGLFSYVTKSSISHARFEFIELISVPLYLFRPSDHYCYVMVHNEIETDFFWHGWHNSFPAANQWFISSTPPENKVKIAIETDPLARFINNFKLQSLDTFRTNITKHPIGFTLVGEESIMQAIKQTDFRPFLPQEQLFDTADFVITHDVFYNTDLFKDFRSLNTLQYMKFYRRNYTHICTYDKKLEVNNFYYAASRNLYMEESVYWTIMQSENIKQAFDSRYGSNISTYPATYKDFMKYYLKEETHAV